ncbi:ATP-grasp domain-containing protein [Lysobacter changpingensis]|uniref:ATP-grasp domain-containing protein n=1 Tax=Lysobacter changpingensis TaxID=2792784 RepID=UPI001A8D85F6|nr:ATP-grasp domain-containing protein [Lysobacter changpingensis]
MNVLLLGGARQCHEGLRDISQRIVLFTRKSAYAFNSYMAKADLEFPYENVHLFADEEGVEDYVRLAKLLHAERPFDAICCFHDGYQEIAINVAEVLAIDMKLSLETLRNIMDKDRARAVLRAAGLDSTEFMLVDTEQQLLTKAEQLGFPLVMKPHDATASSGVSIIMNVAEVALAADYYRRSKGGYPAMLERFHEGPEFSVEGFSEGGVHRILAITRKYVHQSSRVEIGHVIPARLSVEDEEQVKNYVIDVIEALGITDGPTHTEIILTKDGPRFIETHTRGGGDYIWELVRLSTGVNLTSITARQSVGEPVLDSVIASDSQAKSAAIWFLFPDEGVEGRLYDVTNVRAAEVLDGVYDVSILKDRGEKVGPVQNSFDRIAKVIALSDDPDTAIEIAKAGSALLRLQLMSEC